MGVGAPTLASPAGVHEKSEYEMHKIYRNYSSHNDKKMHPIELLLKNFLRRAYSLKSHSNKTEQHYTHCLITQSA